MKNYIGDWIERQETAGEGGVTSGVPVIHGVEFGIANESAAEGEIYNKILAGRFTLPKASGVAFTEHGQAAYFHVATGEVTRDNTDLPIGHSCGLAAADATEVACVIYPQGVNDTELTGKADKDTDATENNIAKFDDDGNPVDAGVDLADVARRAATPTAGHLAGLDADGDPTDSGVDPSAIPAASITVVDTGEVFTGTTVQMILVELEARIAAVEGT